jgi:hypothetical protein
LNEREKKLRHNELELMRKERSSVEAERKQLQENVKVMKENQAEKEALHGIDKLHQHTKTS